jgi:N6-L-threonylcarbamoyladenine synthase
MDTMRVLGIETSCDETAAAVVEKTPLGKGLIHSNIVYSQLREHAPFGGVVPEIAARSHLELLNGVIETAIRQSGSGFNDLDAIAVTAGPGLIGGLLTGLMTAKGLSVSTGLPYFAINHLEGHALTPRMTDGLDFPYLLLLVSGGHSQFVEVAGIGQYRRYGTTIDDALGEAFDKTAKLLSLGHPGGPEVEKMAETGDQTRFKFPRPLSGRNDLNFSFSGLKTAVRQLANEMSPLTYRDVSDICASFQAAVTDVLIDRAGKMFRLFEEHHPTASSHLVIAGGVAANKVIRSALEGICASHNWKLIAPPLELCTDNAAMIAWAGIERMTVDTPSSLDLAPRSRWPLDEISTSLIGSGKRGAKA